VESDDAPPGRCGGCRGGKQGAVVPRGVLSGLGAGQVEKVRRPGLAPKAKKAGESGLEECTPSSNGKPLREGRSTRHGEMGHARRLPKDHYALLDMFPWNASGGVHLTQKNDYKNRIFGRDNSKSVRTLPGARDSGKHGPQGNGEVRQKKGSESNNVVAGNDGWGEGKAKWTKKKIGKPKG